MDHVLKYKKTLMGFSAIWVLLLHYYDQLYEEIHLPVLTQIASIGYVGVEIFLFLSGAGLFCSLSRKYDINDFYKKRIVRTIIPWLMISFPYWILKTIIVDNESIGVFLMNWAGLSFWTNNIHTVWYCAFIAALYAVYPLVFAIQKRKYSIWPTSAAILLFNYALFFISPAYYRTIEIGLTRIPIFLLGSYYAERKMSNKSNRFFYWYGAIGFVLYLLSFIVPIKSDLEIACRRYFAGGFIVIIMIGVVYLFNRSDRSHPVFDFFGEISLEVYLISVLLRNIITRLGLGNGSNVIVKWFIVIAASIAVVMLSKLFSELYARLKLGDRL